MSSFLYKNRLILLFFGIILCVNICFLPLTQGLSINSKSDNQTNKQILQSNILSTLKNENSQISPSFGSISQKIDQELMEMVSNYIQTEKYAKNSSDQISIFIQFRNDITKLQRITLINQINMKILIKSNYNLIPFVSCMIEVNEIINLFQIVNQIPEIVYISPVNRLSLDSNSLSKSTLSDIKWNSPFTYENWWLNAIGMNGVDYSGKDVNLAIMDTGITVHADFFKNGDPNAPRIIKSINFAQEDGVVNPEYVFDDYGHGTHVAGIAGGNGFVSEGKYRGVAPNVNLINVRVLNSTGEAVEDAIIDAIEWCVDNDVDIINMSFGGGLPETWSVESLAIQEAVRRGVVIIAAVGNSGPLFFTGGSPASNLYSIAVGATDINNHVTSFSSLGPTSTGQVLPDVCAPGRSIISTDAYGSVIHLENKFTNSFIDSNGIFNYIELSGTSMATPMVAGAVAILLEAFPEATPEAIRIALMKGAKITERPSEGGETVAQGAGLINVSRSLEYLSNIKDLRFSVNNQSAIFPNSIPFAPFDFLRFPGDKQIYNLTLFASQAMNVSIQIPSIQGVTISVSPNQWEFNSSDLTSIAVVCQVNFDAIPKKVLENINIINSDNGLQIESIKLNFTIAYPKGDLYFDNYHGLTDFFPQRQNGINQIDMYHSLYDLQKWNYSSTFKMEYWTPNYNATTDAELISPQNIIGSDVLVLTTPRIMFSEFEIQTIEKYFNQGGSILLLGSDPQEMCSNSINSLFNRLNVGITIKNTDLNKLYDFGYSSYQNWLEITDLDSNSPITQGISKFRFKSGTSFEIMGPNTTNISSIDGNVVLASYNGQQVGKGRVIAIGSYQPFMDSNYNDPFLYGNHSLLWKNMINYLIPTVDSKISLNIDLRSENNTNIQIAANFYNPEAQIGLEGQISSNLVNEDQTSQDLIFNKISPGLYLNSTSLNQLLQSNKPWIINVSIGSIIKQKAFYFYPQIVEGYLNISTSQKIYKRTSSLVEINIEKPEDITNSSYIGYFSINPISLFGKNPSYNQIVNISDGKGTINPSVFDLSGLGWIYCEANNTFNSTEYMDLTPDRYLILITNNNPIISENISYFANIAFEDTHSDNSISIIQTQIGISYLMEVFVSDEEDDIKDLNVSCVLLQFLSYKGKIYPIYSTSVPYFELTYSNHNNSFLGTITMPLKMTWSVNGETIEGSPESDLKTYFTILWITAKDKDGGSNNFLIFFAITANINNNSNSFTPIFGLFIILGICVILLQKTPKPNKNGIFKKHQ